MAKQRRPPHPTASASDAEQLLRGRKPASADLVGVHGALISLGDAAHEYPSREAADAQARVFSHAAIEAAPTGVLSRQHRSLTKRSPMMKTRARIASAAGAALALLLGTTGAAVAAEETVPGDTFYGFKIALEQMGLTEGGFTERVSEATVLAERGDDARALTHVANSLEEENDGTEGGDAWTCPVSDEGDETTDASPSPEPTFGALTEGEESTEGDDGTQTCDEPALHLRRAAEAVLSGGSEQSLQVRTAVAEMLQWMSTTDAQGRDFGKGVAERARAIGGNTDEGDVEDGDTEEGADDGAQTTEADKGGPPDNAGPPEGTGPNADKDTQQGSKNAGRPDNAGPPAGKGPGAGGGPPEGKGRP